MLAIPCPFCKAHNSSSEDRTIICAGFFRRASDHSRHQRYRCRSCRKSFSSATFEICYRQKKRKLNPLIFELYASGISQRRLALVLRINRKTAVRKFIFLGIQAHFLNQYLRSTFPPSQAIEFDDLETFEHSKMKPLSSIMAVESKTRRILGFRVARMAAKGLLAKRARKKYGPRPDERRRKRGELFQEIRPFVAKGALIQSDQNPHYESEVRKIFPDCEYKTFKGRRGCVVGQGELKAGGFDPIFTLNHTFAMWRANINRLFRRTWNTTKKPERLALHIAIYVLYHNQMII